MKIDNSIFERLEEFKYVEKTLTNQIPFRKKLISDLVKKGDFQVRIASRLLVSVYLTLEVTLLV
jgi:hypothetical protein